MEFTTVANVKRTLRLSTADVLDDGLIQDFTDAANDAIGNYLGRNILSASYTEVRDGTGTNTLVLANTPVTLVGAVTITSPRSFAAAPLNSTPLVSGVDYAWTSSAIKLYCGQFPRGVANVTVVYTAGYATVPKDLTHAATKWAALRYRENVRLGQSQTTLQGQTTAFDLDEFPPDILGIVSRYQSKIPLLASLTGVQ